MWILHTSQQGLVGVVTPAVRSSRITLRSGNRWVLTDSRARSRHAAQPRMHPMESRPHWGFNGMWGRCVPQPFQERTHATLASPPRHAASQWLNLDHLVFMIVESQNHKWHWNPSNCPAQGVGDDSTHHSATCHLWARIYWEVRGCQKKEKKK